jgi:hypothetical protein
VTALVTDASAVAGPDGSVVLLYGGSAGAVSDALATRGCTPLGSGSTAIDPGTLEVDGAEITMVVELHDDVGGTVIRPLTGGQVAYAVGSRSAHLSEVAGGPLPALARVARRVRGFELTHADPADAAREVLRLWA